MAPSGERSAAGHAGYAFAGRGERERLSGVERWFDPPTWAALEHAGVAPGARCWEVGAGAGSIARRLAAAVGEAGEVIATDLDVAALADLPPNVRTLRHDVTAEPPPARDLDVVHARLLLEHVPDPAAVLERLVTALRPGGSLVVEDAAGLRFAARPHAPVLDRLADAWERAAAAVGWDARYGERLVDDLVGAGLADVAARRHCVVAPGGEGWRHVRAGLERLRGELAAAGFGDAELRAAEQVLGDPAVLITGAPLVSAWGRRRGVLAP